MSGPEDEDDLSSFADCDDSVLPPKPPSIIPRSNATGTKTETADYKINQPADCVVAEVPASVFKVRTRGYLKDSVKAPSADALFMLVGFDIYYPKAVDFLAKNPDHTLPKYPTDVPGFKGHATRSMRYPDFLVYNTVIPLERPKVLPEAMTNLWSKIRRAEPTAPTPRPYVQFIVTLAVSPATKSLLDTPLGCLQASRPQLALVKRLLDSGDDDISSRIKLFGACSNIDKLSDLGLPRPIVAFLNRYNGKPMLTRNHTLYNSHKWPRAADVKPPDASSANRAGGYFEILMDVAEKGTVITQTACSQLLARKKLSELGLYLGLLLEGRHENELPERQFCGIHIQNLIVNHPMYDNQTGIWAKKGTTQFCKKMDKKSMMLKKKKKKKKKNTT